MKIPTIFISYAHEDKEIAQKLYNDLITLQLDPWLDSECLLPGQDWRIAIEEAIRNTDFFIALLSENSVSKKGFVQKELKIALDVLDQYPSNSIYMIPTRINDCKISEHRLKSLHYVDLFPVWPEGLEKINKSVGFRLRRNAQTDNKQFISDLFNSTITPQVEFAIGDGDVELLEELLKSGADPNYKEDTYGSMLGYALAETGNELLEYSLAKTLLKYGADVHIPDCHGSSILSDVVFLNKIELTKLLISHGADVNHHGREGWTPLMMAAYYHAPDTLGILLENSANVNAQNIDGDTALILACRDDSQCADDIKREDEALSIVKQLIEHGADISAKNNEGVNALAGAYENSYKRVAAYLESQNC